MIKNIILFFLAICFMLLIISYLLNINQLKLWDSSIIEGVVDGSVSIDQTIATNLKKKLSSELIHALDETLALDTTNSGVLPSNILKNIMNLNIDDTGFKTILQKEINDITKIAELKKYVRTMLKPKLSSDGLILHYVLDNMTGQKVKNIAEETMQNPDYDGIVTGATIDTYDYKYGDGSMRFRYNASKQFNQSDYIKIPSIPGTFYDKDEIFRGFTFATWYKTTSNSKPWARLFEFAVGGGGNHTILASVSFGNEMNYTFFVHGSDNYEINLVYTQTPIPTDKWIHIATTISKDGVYTNYINGVETQSNYSNSVAGLNLGTDNIVNTKSYVMITDPDTQSARVPSNYERRENYIGKSVWYNGDGGFDGRMNDFRIYRKGLNAVEIMDIYNLKNPEMEYKFTNLQIQINAKKKNVIMNNNNTVNSFLDESGRNKPGYPKGDVEYCPKNEIVTILSGQYLEIPNASIENTEFTIAIVANVKNFNPRSHYNVNYLIGGDCNTFELFIHNNTLYCNTTCAGPAISYNMGNFKGDATNMYIIKVDYNNNLTIAINGTTCIDSQNLPHKWELKKNNIFIGRGPRSVSWDSNPQQYWSSNAILFYEFMYIGGECYDRDKQPYLEGYLAKKWGLLESLPGSHPARTNK